jgi:hypothetical protein
MLILITIKNAMTAIINRLNFLQLTTFGAGIFLFSPGAGNAQKLSGEKPPPLNPDRVKEFVIAGHGNLEKVKQMFEQEPGLLNACWDWGGGDFETAIEGAGHTGSKDCANYLLDKGARMNIFCAAMLGKLDIVKGFLSAFPDLKTSKGPHGLQLIHHANVGGEDAKEVLAYLQTIGAM